MEAIPLTQVCINSVLMFLIDFFKTVFSSATHKQSIIPGKYMDNMLAVDQRSAISRRIWMAKR